MSRIALVLFTLLCFTGCTTLQALPDAQPATIEQPSPPADGGELQQSDTPEGDGTNPWITLGVVALLAVVVIAVSGGGGGGGSGY